LNDSLRINRDYPSKNSFNSVKNDLHQAHLSSCLLSAGKTFPLEITPGKSLNTIPEGLFSLSFAPAKEPKRSGARRSQREKKRWLEKPTLSWLRTGFE
jgi:hypothetical protein